MRLSEPSFTVIVPTCNRPDFLARCLAALAPGCQTMPARRYEVIVTDDGTTNSARPLVAERFPWAIWRAGPRRGPAANRNSGAGLSSGNWLAFIDDDCIPATTWLQAYAEAIDQSHRVYEGRTTCHDWVDSPLYEAPINLSGGYLWSCNMLIARDLFEALGGFDEGFPYAAMEDVDLRERIRDRGLGFPFVIGATVDHPKRRRAGGLVKGRHAECQYLFAVKRKREEIGLWSTLLWPAWQYHARMWKRSKVPIHIVPSAWNLTIETVYVATHYAGWKRKYAPRP